MTQIDAQGNQMGNYAYVNPEGNIQETSEVAAARVAHIAAHAVALAAAKKASSSQESRNTPQPKEAVPLPQPTWTLPVQPLSTPAVHQTWFISPTGSSLIQFWDICESQCRTHGRPSALSRYLSTSYQCNLRNTQISASR